MSALLSVLTLVVGGGGGLAALITAIASARKHKSDVRESEARGVEIAQKAALAAQQFYGGTIAHQNERILQLGERVTWLEAAFSASEQRAADAEAKVRELKAWVDAGFPPPPPEWPAYVHLPVSSYTPSTLIRPPINRKG